MSNEATEFLERIASKNGYNTYRSLSGEVKFDDTTDEIGGNTKIYLSSGAVYCFLAIPTKKSSVKDLFSETKSKTIPIDNKSKALPIYFGKDINPGSRIADHVRPRSKTGNAELEKIASLRGFKLIYGAIYVDKYSEFENLLHSKFSPLVGSPKHGSRAKFTFIVD